MMAFILGAAVVVQPLVLVGAVGAVVLISLVTRPWGRLVIFVVGALITLQSSEGLTVWKLGYVALTVLCAAIAAHRCLRDGEDRAIRLSIFGVGLLGFLMLLSAVRPLWTGQATAGDVARDAITYGLIMAAVPIGADAGRHFQQRVIVYVIVAAGLLSSVAIALDWLDRRGVSTLGQGRVAFGSGLIVAVAVALAAVKALGGPRVEVTWLMLLVVLPLGVLVTGARSGLVLGVAMLGVVGTRRKMRVPAYRMLGGAIVVAALLVVALPFLAARVAREGFLAARVAAAMTVLQGGVGQDQSGQIRQRATEYALAAWHEHMFLGQGLGYHFPNPNPDSSGTSFWLDTPATYLAKFGLLGTLILTAALLLMMSFARSQGWTTARAVACGVSLMWVAWLPFGPFTEDKGFALSIALLFALLAASTARDGPTDRSSLVTPGRTPASTRTRWTHLRTVSGIRFPGRAGTH